MGLSTAKPCGYFSAKQIFSVMSANQPTKPEISVPLCVDMDGTLIKTDVLWISLRLLLKGNPMFLFAVPGWWLRGRAFLKQQIANRVELNPAGLPYILPFIEFLKREKAAGRKLVLATAADRRLADLVARHVGVFSEVIASDGIQNLRGSEKGRVLSERFGRHQFDYAGNSRVDIPVWREARKAIVVNASTGLLRRARRMFDVASVF
jgi:phosphoserine phosphatase